MKKSVMDRRKFLRSSAMAAAVATVQQRALGAPSETAASPPGTITWDKAPCRFCGTGCHVKVGVEGGKVVAIKGHEQAAVNQGLLCVKGYHVGGILYGEDRLTQPLIRRDGKLVPISWDEAITAIAERIAKNPKGFAFYGSGQWTVPEGYAAQKLMKGGLSNNHIEPNARLCMASAVTGFISTYGVDEPAGCYDDLDACDVVITWGNNPAEMHPVLFSRMIDRRSRGEKLTLIDLGTRRTRTTEFADHYLEFKPQSDLAIANCIAQQLIANDTYDKQFVEKFCAFRADPDPSSLLGKPIGFEAYKKAVAVYTPEYTAKISGLSVEQLKMLGDLFGKRDIKITSLWCMGMNQHTRGTAINRLVHGIHLLSGHFGKPGDAPTSLTGQPSACGTAREVGTLAHALPGGRLVAKEDHRKYCEEHWNLPPGRINAKPGYHTVLMWEEFCTPTAEGGDIDTMFVQVTNPGQSLPNLNKLYKAKNGLEDKFLIVSDVYPTASTELADLVLPASMWVEKNGVFGNSERRTQQWFKMVEPPGQARDDTWMTIALARKLYEMGVEGMKDKDGRFLFHYEASNGAPYPCWDWDRYYSDDFNVDRALFEEYRAMTTAKHKDVAPYDELVKTQGLRWPVVQQADGSWRETRYRFSEFDDPYVEKGKEIQFYHSTTKDDRAQIWFCPYEDPPEMPDDVYPFWLCTGRVLEHWHTGSMTMRVPELQGSMPHAYVELHPDDAKNLGIGNSDIALLQTRRGKMKLPVWIDGRGKPPRGSVFVPFFDETLLINDLTLHDFCPVSKEPDYKKCAVSVSKAPPA